MEYKKVSWALKALNRFTVLEIDKYIPKDYDLSDIPIYLLVVGAHKLLAALCKILVVYSTINIVNIYKL